MSLKKQMVKGVFWSAVEKYSGLLISLIISSILARLISPSEFGVVAIATVLVTFLNIFTDLGIGPAVIQHRELTKTDLDSIFTYSIIIGIVLCILFYFSSEFIAKFYNSLELVIVCKVLSVKLFFSSLNVVPQATMLKNREFKNIAKRTLLFNVFSGALSIYAAYRGAGVYALLISPLITSVGMLVYNLNFYPRSLDVSLNISPLKSIFSYSIFQFLFTLMNFFSRNLDSLIIGKFFPLRELGYYEKSYRLMMLPLQNVTHVITPVIQPVFSSMQDNLEDMSKKYYAILKLIATISFPLSIFLFFSGAELIRIVYGANWEEAIPVFKVLALSLSLQMLLSTTGSIYQSANATNWMFYNGLINTLSTISGFVVATILFRSITAMAWAWNITLFINSIVSFYILYRIVLKDSLLNLLKRLFVPLITAIVCSVVIGLINPMIHFHPIFDVMINFSVIFFISCLIVQFSGHYDLYSIVQKKFLSQ